MRATAPYPSIGDYAIIGDGHSAALISRSASIDWYCVPRFDGGAAFGRLVNWERGGFCQISPAADDCSTSCEYLANTLVLVTTYTVAGGEARLIDCFTMSGPGRQSPYPQLLRVVEGVRGSVNFQVRIQPRFDYGEAGRGCATTDRTCSAPWGATTPW